MVHFIKQANGQLKMKKDGIAKEKQPAICISFFGCLLIIGGASAIGVSGATNNAVATKVMGSITLIGGIVTVLGALYMKVHIHHKLKEKKADPSSNLNTSIKKRPGSTISSSTISTVLNNSYNNANPPTCFGKPATKSSDIVIMEFDDLEKLDQNEHDGWEM